MPGTRTVTVRVCRWVLLALSLPTAIAGQTEPGVFRTATHLVVHPVVVKDERGNVVENLATSDFTVTEDGRPQQVAFAEFQRLDGAAPPAPVAISLSPASTAGGIAVPKPGTAPYRHRRLLVMYFDLSAMPPFDRQRALLAGVAYVTKEMTPADLVAVMAFDGGAVRVHHDFTDRVEDLAAALRMLNDGDRDADGVPDARDPSSAFGENDAEFATFSTDRQFSALQTAVTMLRPLPESKSLIYFGSGLRLNGADNQAQLRATINAAVRANVTINPIDARGLVATAPMGDATARAAGGLAMFSGGVAQSLVSRLQRSQDMLYSLAKDTGGVAFLDANDLSRGIAEAARNQSSYYLVAYYSAQPPDGRLRRVRVDVNGRRDVRLSYRPGYYGERPFRQFTAADKERQLEEALRLEDPITEISVALEVNYFRLSRAEYFVPVAVRIPARELTLARSRGAARTEIDVIAEIKDDHGVTYRNVRDRLNVSLTADRVEELTKSPLHYETGFTLLPGRYILKILIRDATTGRIGTHQSDFVVPNLERDDGRLPTSSVVLGSQQVALTDALLTVRSRSAADEVDPLVHEGRKLLPSVSRSFRRNRTLHIYLQVYPPRAGAARALIGFVALYRAGSKVVETAPALATAGLDARSVAVPLRFNVPLDAIAIGEYECQVTVLDPEGQRAAFWRASIVVVP